MRAPSALALIAIFVLAASMVAYWSYERAGRLPPEFASANGHIEVQRVDIASKLVGRVGEPPIKIVFAAIAMLYQSFETR